MRILGLSSFVPEQICDVIKFDGYQGESNISHYCGYIADYLSQVIEDESIDGAVYPKTCDSSRVITSYLGNSNKFLHQIHVPARQDEYAVEIFAESIKLYKEAVEKFYDVVISEKEINYRNEIICARNTDLEAIYDNLKSINYSEYLRLMHDLQKMPLNEQMEYIKNNRPESIINNGKRVFLIGSRVTNMSIIEGIELSGMTVVGDNITESKRFYSQRNIEGIDNLYKKIAKSILSNRLSPTQNNFGEILTKDIYEIRRKNVQGVIFLTQKYCEPYDYLYSVYKRVFDDMDIPILRISVSGTTSVENSKLLLEAFSEMI